MGMSRRAYARHRRVSESAVRKALATGRITLEADGTIDPIKADAEWDSQTDPAKQRGPHARRVADETKTSTKCAAEGKPVPNAAIDAVNATLGESGADPAPSAAAGEMSFLRARMANEVLKAQTARVRLDKMKGELVDRARTTALVFDLARRERDAWQGWPARVAANMAAELGVDAHQMEQVLDKYLRKHLTDLAEFKIELR